MVGKIGEGSKSKLDVKHIQLKKKPTLSCGTSSLIASSVYLPCLVKDSGHVQRENGQVGRPVISMGPDDCITGL